MNSQNSFAHSFAQGELSEFSTQSITTDTQKVKVNLHFLGDIFLQHLL